MSNRKRKTCRHPKSKPYGAKGTEPYCKPHDTCRVYSVNNKVIRQKTKLKIKKEDF